MLCTTAITIQTHRGEREILISPFLLQSKTPPVIKSGTFTIAVYYFYEHLTDEHYQPLPVNGMPERSWSDVYAIYPGQDLEKHYLGSLQVDADTRRSWNWVGEGGKLHPEEVRALQDSIFEPSAKSRQVALMRPVQPSDFKVKRMRKKR